MNKRLRPFAWLALGIFAVLNIAGIKLSQMTQTTTLPDGTLFLVSTNPGFPGSTRTISDTNLITALAAKSTWPSASSLSATNIPNTNATQFGVFSDKSGAVLRFFGLEQGTNTVLYRNGSNIVINSQPGGAGSSVSDPITNRFASPNTFTNNGATRQVGASTVIGAATFFDIANQTNSGAIVANGTYNNTYEVGTSQALIDLLDLTEFDPSGNNIHIRLRPGTYSVTPSIVKSNGVGAINLRGRTNMILEGQPGLTIIDGTSALGEIFWISNCNNLTIRGLTIRGMVVTNWVSMGAILGTYLWSSVGVYQCANLRFENNFMDGGTDHGIMDYGAFNVLPFIENSTNNIQILNNRFYNFGSSFTNSYPASVPGDGNAITPTGWLIEGNYISDCLLGIEPFCEATVRGSNIFNNCIIRNNTIVNCLRYGIFTGGSTNGHNIIVEGNTIHYDVGYSRRGTNVYPDADGINFNGGQAHKIKNNKVSGARNAGIVFGSSIPLNNCEITGNLVFNVTNFASGGSGRGIVAGSGTGLATASAGAIIAGNTVLRCQSEGIRLAGLKDSVFANNVLFNAQSTVGEGASFRIISSVGVNSNVIVHGNLIQDTTGAQQLGVYIDAGAKKINFHENYISGFATDFTDLSTAGEVTKLDPVNNAWATGRGALRFYDGTASNYIVATLVSDSPSNGQVPKWNTGGTITWENDSTGVGSFDGLTSGITNNGIFVSTNGYILFGYTGDVQFFTNNFATYQRGQWIMLDNGQSAEFSEGGFVEVNNGSTIQMGRDTVRGVGATSIAFGTNDYIASIPSGTSDNAEHRRYRFSADITGNNTNLVVRFRDLVTNTASAAGFVDTGSGQVSKVWKTDASGNPAWRDDATGVGGAIAATYTNDISATSQGTNNWITTPTIQVVVSNNAAIPSVDYHPRIVDTELLEWSGIGTNAFAAWVTNAAQKAVTVAAGTAIGVATNNNNTNITYTVSVNDTELLEWSGIGTNAFAIWTTNAAKTAVTVAAGTGITVTTNNNGTNITYTVTGAAAGTNFAGIVLTNAIQFQTSHQVASSNLTVDWSKTNYYVFAPTNNFQVTFANHPTSIGLAQTIYLQIQFTNGTSGLFPTNGLDGLAPTLLSSPSTNEYWICWNGSNATWIVSGQQLTTGTGPTVLQTNATLWSPILGSTADPTTDAAGELGFDNNAWAASRGAPEVFDGTASIFLLGSLASDTPGNGQVPKWNTGGTITWEDDSTGGNTAFDAIGDPSGNGSIAFGATTQFILSTLDSGSVLSVTNTDADIAADTRLLNLNFVDGADANAIYATFVGDSDGTPATDYLFSQTLFQVGANVTADLDAAASVLVPTVSADDNDTSAASTAYVQTEIAPLQTGSFVLSNAVTTGIQTNVYDTIYVDAAAMVSNITAGATFSTEESSAPTNRMVDSYVFSGSTSNFTQFKLAMPLDWDLGTVRVKLWTWSTNNLATTTNVWCVEASALKTTTVLTNTSWGTAAMCSNNVSSAGGQVLLTPATETLTVGNTPAAAGQLVAWRIWRNTGHGLDRDSQGADGGQQKLLGAWIQYKRSLSAVAQW